MKEIKQLFVSAVCYLDGSEHSSEHEARLLHETLTKRYAYVEIILVCGSHEGAWLSCVEIAKELPDIRAYRISGKAGENAGLTWGLEMAIGDMVVTCRLRPSFHLGVVDLVEASLSGTGLACAVRRAERGWVANLSVVITRLLTGVEYDPTSTPYWAVSRTLINQMLSSPSIDRSISIRLRSLAKSFTRVVIGAKVPPMTFVAGLIAIIALIIRVSPLPARCLATFSVLSLIAVGVFVPHNTLWICLLAIFSQLSLLSMSERTMKMQAMPVSILAEVQSQNFLRDQGELNTLVG